MGLWVFRSPGLWVFGSLGLWVSGSLGKSPRDQDHGNRWFWHFIVASIKPARGGISFWRGRGIFWRIFPHFFHVDFAWLALSAQLNRPKRPPEGKKWSTLSLWAGSEKTKRNLYGRVRMEEMADARPVYQWQFIWVKHHITRWPEIYCTTLWFYQGSHHMFSWLNNWQ